MKKLFTPVLLAVAFVIVSANLKSDETENVEAFSISLNVKDIKASVEFYSKLGFEPVPGGSIESKWMIMKNGAAKIGLFQGFFPQNTITLNPKDARSIFKAASKAGLEAPYQTGMDKNEGPASFSLVDPDGNPILIDQHK